MQGQVAYQQYKEVQIKTANQGKLLLMLYQGCVKFLRLAKRHIEDKNFAGANENLIKAQSIINELMITLDREKGGEIADNLYKLYDFMNRQLIQANIKKEIKSIEIVEELILELLDAWKEIINKTEKQEVED